MAGIEDVDWARLEHAYGRAKDTPHHLAALAGDDQRAIAQALGHLETAVLHQGYAYPAAVPVVRVVAGYLGEMAVAPGLRGCLLEFLGEAAEAVFGMERCEWCDRSSLPGLHEALVATYPSVHAYLNVDDRALRTSAAAAAVAYASCAPLADQRPAAFRPGYRAGKPITRSQRLILEALLDNPQLWEPKDGNASLVFKQAGLPRDRDRCRRILTMR